MNDLDRKIIVEKIAPRVNSAEISLLLGAGFSITNKAGAHTLPGGEELKLRLLEKCGKQTGKSTTLKDAYQLARRTLPDFEIFFAECFKATESFAWQKKIFQYAWSRIYTTNIDNVLDISADAAIRQGRMAGEFKFFNYIDEGLISETIGIIPVVTIHGTCKRLEDGFVFSTLEYAKAATKVLDWHNDLAARIIAGGVIVIGNQLDESDLDVYLSRRQATYENASHSENWIVLPTPDEIKADNWASAGFHVIDSTAEDFFNVLFEACSPRTIGEIVLEKLPSAKKASLSIKAMTWFKSSFKLAFDEIENARNQNGILKHFITGSSPDWFFIVNDAHADTSKGAELLKEAARLLQDNSTGIGLLHVIGPSGSGKTTAIRNALRQLVRTYKFTYEFDENQNIDKVLFRSIVDGLTEKSIFVFYSAAEYYFAIKEISDRHRDRPNPYCLFILEDRTSEHKKNKRQLSGSGIVPKFVELGALTRSDAESIALKMEEAGLIFEKFSEKSLEARASIILDKEKGFGGDLLSTLFSLTTHENFELKIYQDYKSAGDGLARSVLNLVAILHSLNYSTPIDYIAGALSERIDDITRCLTEDLAGVLVTQPGSSILRCRHRVIADYYFKNHIAGNGSVELLLGLLEYLSRKFTIEDIRFHPLPYRIYRDIISFEFVYEQYFPLSSRNSDTEKLYHESQKLYGRDGIFWLHFGRFYRKIGKLPEAIDCFRTGLEFYDSFQTRHSLGMTLLELYILDGDIDHYRNGADYLNNERISRSVSDPYPTATLLRLLTQIVVKFPTNTEASDLAKVCWNYGMRHFKDDEHFAYVANEYMRQSSK